MQNDYLGVKRTPTNGFYLYVNFQILINVKYDKNCFVVLSEK